MKLRDQICVIIAIIVVLILIFHKMEQDNQARINTIETEQQALMDAIKQNEIIILSMTTDLATANEKLTEWEDIDVRWLKWIEDNWYLVKSLDGGGD